MTILAYDGGAVGKEVVDKRAGVCIAFIAGKIPQDAFGMGWVVKVNNTSAAPVTVFIFFTEEGNVRLCGPVKAIEALYGTCNLNGFGGEGACNSMRWSRCGTLMFQSP